jgi:large subunit ribosomal protein L21
MFAVVRTGGKQYRVAPGDKIVVEKLDGNAGDRITLGEVLLAGDGGDLKSTDGLTVAAEIVAQAKGEKVTVFKKRRRHNYRRKKGHRQQHTILRIVAIGDHKAEKPARAAKPAAAPPAEAPAAAKPSKQKAKAEAGAPEVDTQPTENPAPESEAQANPSVEGDVEASPKKAGGGKKAAGGDKKPKAASTENAAPAKGAAKKSPKAK